MFVGLDLGDMVCGEYGLGCMFEFYVIFFVIEDYFVFELFCIFFVVFGFWLFVGKKVLIMVGLIYEFIDLVWYIVNWFSGK